MLVAPGGDGVRPCSVVFCLDVFFFLPSFSFILFFFGILYFWFSFLFAFSFTLARRRVSRPKKKDADRKIRRPGLGDRRLFCFVFFYRRWSFCFCFFRSLCSFVIAVAMCPEWVLLGFAVLFEFYLALLGFTGFYLVLLGFTGFYGVGLSFTWCYRVLLGFTGFYGV